MNTYVKGSTLTFTFRSRDASGAAAALTGGAVSVYRGTSTTQFTTGVTLTADFDSVTGLNHVAIDTTDAAYATGADFHVILTAGTVDGTSVAGEPLYHFTLTASAGVGSGARTVTATVNDGTTALASAIIRFTKGSESIATTTNGSGIGVVNLDDGTWTVAITKSGYSFAGTNLVVDGDETATYSMTTVSVVPSGDPNQTIGVLTTRDEHGDAEGEVVITFKLERGPGDDGHAYSSDEFTATSNGSGVLTVTLVRGAVYHARRGNRKWVTVATPTASSSFDLPEVLGVDA